MEYIKGTTDFKIEEETVISLGKFDGLHMGHKLLMDYVMRKKGEGYQAVVFTFDIPPKARLNGEIPQVLTTNDEKMHILEQIGIDYLIECPFTREIMEMEPEDFIRMLVEKLHVKCMVVGTDFHFGHNRRGDFVMLQAYAKQFGYEVEVVDKMRYEDRDISSTFVREELVKGEIEKANHLLGYFYFVQGNVQHGNQIGRTIGIPTVNLHVDAQKLLPPYGVYVARVHVDENVYGGIANIGKKPTVGADYPVGVETHIFDFDKDIYDENIKVELLHYVRPEQKFSSVESLMEQMQRDIQFGQQFLENHSGKGRWI